MQGNTNAEMVHEIIYDTLLKENVFETKLFSRILIDGLYSYEVYKENEKQIAVKYNTTTGGMEIEISLNFYENKIMMEKIEKIFQAWMGSNKDSILSYNSEVSFWEYRPSFNTVIEKLQLEYKPERFHWKASISSNASFDSIDAVISTLMEISSSFVIVFKLYIKKKSCWRRRRNREKQRNIWGPHTHKGRTI